MTIRPTLNIEFLATMATYSTSYASLPGFPATDSISTVCAYVQHGRIPFIVNRGQFNRNILYFSPIADGTTSISTSGDLIYSRESPSSPADCASLRLPEIFVDNSVGTIRYVDHNPMRGNWLKGVDLPTYSAISLGEGYPGIEAADYVIQGTTERVFTVYPGVGPGDIRLRFVEANLLTRSNVEYFENYVYKNLTPWPCAEPCL